MKRFPNCVHKLFYEPLIITPTRHAALCKVLESRMAGEMPPMMPDEPDEDDIPSMQTIRADVIIPVHGVLTNHADDIPASSCGCGCDTVAEMIKMARADDSVETILFDFRTPGGAVNGIPELSSQIASITSKTTIAFTDSECCSAGIWLASQCHQFYCTESASVGSIGVWCAYLNISRQMENEGVKMEAISAGKYKLLGAYWKQLTDDERQMLQDDVDKIYGKFKEAVNSRREISDEFMQGQIFDGEKACEIGLCDGLVDEIGDLLEDSQP
jgi:protease-4